jgi:HEPN domain-containing protein
VPPPSPAPGTAREWLERAQGKLVLARQPLPPGGYWEDLCFLAQQASELAIKAVYQVHGWSFPFVHNLGMLLDGLERLSFTG